MVTLLVIAHNLVCISYNRHLFRGLNNELFSPVQAVASHIDPEAKTSRELEIYLDYKPWRGPKPQNLKVHYKPWTESWRETCRNESDQTIYLYSVPERRSNFEATRLNDVWMWPWLWSKVKAERQALIQKHFDNDLGSMSVQEHMELDSLYSEFDMPVRWGLLRLKELEVVNILILWLAFWTDFHGTKPTDLGVRPDGSVRTCSVELHNCISSSNEVTDAEHYAPPFRWARSKSPEQAFEEVKGAYSNYPKRGLKWTNGWIDRGGWRPQQFSGNYFYAQADSLAFRWTDDIELVLDNNKREVQYRSSSRLGREDFDVQRLRYNQFARMLGSKGGWEVRPLPRLHYLSTTPYRWTNRLLDKAATALHDGIVQSGYSRSVAGVQSAVGKVIASITGPVRRAVEPLSTLATPALRQLQELGTGESQSVYTIRHWWQDYIDRARSWRRLIGDALGSLESEFTASQVDHERTINAFPNSATEPIGGKYISKDELLGKYLLRDAVPVYHKR